MKRFKCLNIYRQYMSPSVSISGQNHLTLHACCLGTMMEFHIHLEN